MTETDGSLQIVILDSIQDPRPGIAGGIGDFTVIVIVDSVSSTV